MIRLIIFDWDDVFTLGSKEGYFACYQAAMDAIGLRMDPAVVRTRVIERWGSSYRFELEWVLQEHPDLVDAACAAYEKFYYGATFLDRLRLPGDVPALVTRLHKSLKLGIATGQNPGFLRDTVFPRFGIPAIFDSIVTAYDVPGPEYHKPDPYMIDRIMAETGISPDETVMVGDARQDMEMAFNAGVHAVAVLTGHLTAPEAEALGVDRVIDSVMDIESCLPDL